MAKRQLYYRVDIREVERMLGFLRAKRADFHYAVLAGSLERLGVTPDFDKVAEIANQQALEPWNILDKSLTINEVFDIAWHEEI